MTVWCPVSARLTEGITFYIIQVYNGQFVYLKLT